MEDNTLILANLKSHPDVDFSVSWVDSTSEIRQCAVNRILYMNILSGQIMILFTP